MAARAALVLMVLAMGAGRPQVARRAAGSALRLMAVYIAVTATLFLTLPEWIAGLFGPRDDSPDFAAAVALCRPLFAWMALLGCMARGIGLECRAQAANKRPWSLLFGWGSLAVILAHGFLIGSVLQGMPFTGRTYMGGAFDWFSPFTLLVCLTFVCLYVTLAAGWLVLKTGGNVEAAARRSGLRWGLATLASLVLTIAYIVSSGHIGYLVGRPSGGGLALGFVAWIVAAVVAAILFFRALATGGQGRPFFWCAVMCLPAFHRRLPDTS